MALFGQNLIVGKDRKPLANTGARLIRRGTKAVPRSTLQPGTIRGALSVLGDMLVKARSANGPILQRSLPRTGLQRLLSVIRPEPRRSPFIR